MSDTHITLYDTDDGAALCEFYSDTVPAVGAAVSFEDRNPDGTLRGLSGRVCKVEILYRRLTTRTAIYVEVYLNNVVIDE